MPEPSKAAQELPSFEHSAAPPCVFVLFGATGDLAARKIAPALYNLARDGYLGDRTAVLGVARRARTNEQFRSEMFEAVKSFSRTPADDSFWKSFAPRWHYCSADADSLSSVKALAAKIAEVDSLHACGGGRLFYLAMRPEALEGAVKNLGQAGLNRPPHKDAFARIVVEKPFGRDLASAQKLNASLRGEFDESQVFRIDHFLGKETVQNILAFRFANILFDPMLSREYVDNVQISTTETVGMEGRRGAYYEESGALRDMVQNHMLQLLALVAMSSPRSRLSEDVRREKARVLESLVLPTREEVARCTVRGQYLGAEGVPAYRQEEGVDPNSGMETYVALRCHLNDPRWAGVPFYLRTGKRLAEKRSEIIVVFRRERGKFFDDGECSLRGRNKLEFRITPGEGIRLVFDAKLPGVRMLLRPVRMDFGYGSSFESASPEAYEHLLLDAMSGDASLFLSRQEVEASWRYVDGIRNAWDADRRPELVFYPPKSWGPPQAETLFEDPYCRWQVIGS
jgi:glucose-6-phosphate 1-dehydrogenase